MAKIIRIGTRESPLAVWQARQVQDLLTAQNISSQLVYIKSEGDRDLITPLYAIGVQGIFTRALDAALLNNRIDIAVHSLKDVPVQLAAGIVKAAVLKRASYKDVFVYKNESDLEKLGYANSKWTTEGETSNVKRESTVYDSPFTIATSSIRRIAQWLNRYPHHAIENLRGNVNTRLNKVYTNTWNGAIFAAAGIERINMRPENAIDIDWMLPAPAQGAIAVVCRNKDDTIYQSCQAFNDEPTAVCVKIERDFLSKLMGGCSTPIGALAIVQGDTVHLKGNVLSIDGKQKIDIEKTAPFNEAGDLGKQAGEEILNKGAAALVEQIRNAR